jgi:hypothetical protein
LKALEMVGVASPATVRLAVLLAVPAVGVWVVVTPEVVLGLTPAVVLVTLKTTVQELFTSMLAPVKERLVWPAVRVLGDAPQLPVTFPPTALMLTSVSVKAPPPRANAALGLVSVRVTVELPPDEMEAGLKALAMVGGAYTSKVAMLLGFPAAGVCVVVTPEVMLVWAPAVLLVTLKMMVQLGLPGGMVIPVKLSEVCPAVKVAGVVPAQVPVTFPPTALMFVSVSVKAPLVKVVPLELPNVSVTVEEPPTWIDAGLNVLEIVGPMKFVTVRLAVLLPAPAVGVCVVVTPEVVLGHVPEALLSTVNVTVQLADAGILILVKLKFPAPN